VIIKSQQTALAESLIQRFEHPERFGVSLTAQGLLLSEALESLVAVNEWDWLTRDVLADRIYRSDLFELQDRYLTYVHDKVRREHHLTLPSSLYSGTLYFPDAKEPACGLSEQGFIEIFPDRLWAQMLRERRAGPSSRIRLFYTTFEKAATVGWALSGDLKSVDIRSTKTEMLGPDVQIGALNDDVLLVKGISLDSLRVTAATAEQKRIREVQIHIWVKETLYMDDPGMQSSAAANLYEVLQQKDVESLLLPFLEDPDPDVRFNVLTALGMPAYKVGFVPGASLPPRGVRIEPVTVQPSTLCSLLTVLKRETNQHVLDNFVCILSAQSFEGKLRPYTEEVRTSMLELMPRLESKQSAKDCAEIIAELSLDE
jgi:hypothetical protein